MDRGRLPFLVFRRVDRAMLLNRNQAWEFSLLALCLWREGRGEPYSGKLGIAWAIRNRVFTHNSWWGSDWERVILMPWQFSSFNPGDPNSVKFPGDPIQDPAWAECLAVAEAVYTNSIADPTNGATHYFAASLHPQPAWAKTAEFKIQLGNHLFFKAA